MCTYKLFKSWSAVSQSSCTISVRPPALGGGISCSVCSGTQALADFDVLEILIGVQWYLTVVLICISQMAYSVSSLVKMSVQVFLTIFSGVVCFLSRHFDDPG